MACCSNLRLPSLHLTSTLLPPHVVRLVQGTAVSLLCNLELKGHGDGDKQMQRLQRQYWSPSTDRGWSHLQVLDVLHQRPPFGSLSCNVLRVLLMLVDQQLRHVVLFDATSPLMLSNFTKGCAIFSRSTLRLWCHSYFRRALT